MGQNTRWQQVRAMLDYSRAFSSEFDATFPFIHALLAPGLPVAVRGETRRSLFAPPGGRGRLAPCDRFIQAFDLFRLPVPFCSAVELWV